MTYLVAMETVIVSMFKAWCRRYGKKNPTGQDAAQFCTDHLCWEITGLKPFPPGTTWPIVYDVLKARRLFD